VISQASAEGREHALVTGAGMAGLLVALVLADHYERVTLLDRDGFPDQPGFRNGVPQSPHTHVLLGRGLSTLDTLIPGLQREILDAGAVPIDWPGDALWLTAAGWSERFRPGTSIVSVSRDLLEWTVRQHVLRHPRVHVLPGVEVRGVLTDPGATTVIGARIRQRGQTGTEEDLSAALVVDATGRRSDCCRWLADLGYPTPDEMTIPVDIGYASRFYARVPEDRGWNLMLLQAQPPHHTRSGMMLPVDGDRWNVSLVGRLGERPPTDDRGFLEFAAGLRSPVLYEFLKDSEPVSSARGFSISRNYRRRFDTMSRWPDRFVVVGDAVCSLNPVFGQGMSVAALGALELREELERTSSTDDLTRRLQASSVRASADAWMVASSEDLRYLALSTGERPPLRSRIVSPYFDRAIRAALRDRLVNSALLDVMNLERSPMSLMHPRVLMRVIRPRLTTAEAEHPAELS